MSILSATTTAAMKAAVKKVVYGTEEDDQFDFSGAKNDGITVKGGAGHDTLSLYDVYDATWKGGGGIDISRSELGYNNFFNGGAAPDMYFLLNEIHSEVYDASGSSAVSDVGGEELDITLEGGGNIFNGVGTRNSDITLEGGGNKVQQEDSGGGNIFRIDQGTVRLTYGPSFSGKSMPDVIRIGSDGVTVEVEVDYNASGRAELKITGWDPTMSSINFGSDQIPTFVATDGNVSVAAYNHGDFSVLAKGPGASVANGVVLGSEQSGIGQGHTHFEWYGADATGGQQGLFGF